LWMNEGGECLAGKKNSSKGLNHSLSSLSLQRSLNSKYHSEKMNKKTAYRK
jgi:hypothetical protein